MARRLLSILILILISLWRPGSAGNETSGIRGDPEAIAAAEAMVEAMGGKAIWSEIYSIHFVHEWHPWYRPDSYIENEILDLTAPRSWVEMKSEIYHRIRAYSPEYGYWSLTNGEYSKGDEEHLKNALERAPYSIYRLARAIARADNKLEIRFGKGDIPRTRRLEFYGTDGVLHGWIILNVKMEPIVWATTQYRYTFGPMKRFGNLRVPDWAVYENGTTRYEMISLSASTTPPDPSLFMPPPEYRE